MSFVRKRQCRLIASCYVGFAVALTNLLTLLHGCGFAVVIVLNVQALFRNCGLVACGRWVIVALSSNTRKYFP